MCGWGVGGWSEGCVCVRVCVCVCVCVVRGVLGVRCGARVACACTFGSVAFASGSARACFPHLPRTLLSPVPLSVTFACALSLSISISVSLCLAASQRFFATMDRSESQKFLRLSCCTSTTAKQGQAVLRHCAGRCALLPPAECLSQTANKQSIRCQRPEAPAHSAQQTNAGRT